MQATGSGQSHNLVVLKTLGATLILTSVAAVFCKRFHVFDERLRGSRPVPFKAAQPAPTVGAGAILGFLVTFISIGAGALGAVMLLYLYPRRLTSNSPVGTDIVHAIPLTIAAGTGHLSLGNVDGLVLMTLFVVSIPGIVIGSPASTRMSERPLRIAIAIILALVGLKVLFV